MTQCGAGSGNTPRRVDENRERSRIWRDTMNSVMYSSKSNEWETPQELFDRLDREFHFTLDPASTHENAKCAKHYTQEENGLAQDWRGETVFCNPPYGRELPLWIEKAAKSAGGVRQLSCSFLRGRTRGLFTILSWTRPRYAF